MNEKFKKCKEESGVSIDVALKVKSKDFDFDDQNGKCFAKCLCHSKGFCDADNKLDATKVFEKKPEISKEKVNIQFP